MIVDASAVIAIVLEEQDKLLYQTAIAFAKSPLFMSSVNYVEAGIRCDKAGAEFGSMLDALMRTGEISAVEVTPEHARLARAAYRRFGKGNHPAKLNLGDCFAYALAKARGETLLFKGGDFRLTDVEAAL